MSTVSQSQSQHTDAIDQLRAIGRQFFARGWSVGTSSNFSFVSQRDPLELTVTARGKDKGQLASDDFVVVDGSGKATFPGQPESSAETLLHTALAADPNVGCVLHTHSIWGTLLSDECFAQQALTIGGYEMLKGLAGIATHQASVTLQIFDNTQDIGALAAQVAKLRANNTLSMRHGFLLRNHGLYAWGRDVDEARRHVEVLEFLFEVVGRKMSLRAM